MRRTILTIFFSAVVARVAFPLDAQIVNVVHIDNVLSFALIEVSGVVPVYLFSEDWSAYIVQDGETIDRFRFPVTGLRMTIRQNQRPNVVFWGFTTLVDVSEAKMSRPFTIVIRSELFDGVEWRYDVCEFECERLLTDLEHNTADGLSQYRQARGRIGVRFFGLNFRVLGRVLRAP